MPGKRISELTALSGAASANNDDLLIFDSGAGETKRISRSQLAEGMVPDLPLQYYLGVLNANPTQRLNGDALQIGDFYLDAVTKYTTVYNGSGWNSYASVIAAQVAAEAARTGAETAETNAETAEAGAVAAQVAAELAQAGAELAETNAETARDAAFVNADVYADTAAGLAGTTLGEQFQVVSGAIIYRYRHDSGPVAALVATYPAAVAVFDPKYTNAGGQGDRTASIRIFSDAGMIALGTLDNLVDGSTVSDATGSVRFNTIDMTGKRIIWDFGPGASKVITEVTWRVNTSAALWTVKWQGSRDGVNWVDLTVNFTLGGATVGTHDLSANASGWRYYSLVGVSGSNPSVSYWHQEVEFKIDGDAADGVAYMGDSLFHDDFPTGKLISAWLFDEESGDTVVDHWSRNTIDLADPAVTNPNATRTRQGVKLKSGLIQTPTIQNAREVVILYRTGYGQTGGFLLSGGSTSGSSVSQNTYPAADGVRVAGCGFGLRVPVGRLNVSTYQQVDELNRGTWMALFRTFDANYNTILGFGARHSTTTTRCADFEIAYAFAFNAALTDDERNEVIAWLRKRAAADKGILFHRDDALKTAPLTVMLGDSQCDGRARFETWPTFEQNTNLAPFMQIMAGGHSNGRNRFFAGLVLGANQKIDSPITNGGIEESAGLELALAADYAAGLSGYSVMPHVVKYGIGGTHLAPSATGTATGGLETWFNDELETASVFHNAMNHLHRAMGVMVEQGVGFDEVKFAIYLGNNDMGSTLDAPDSATYQGYCQGFWDEIKARFSGINAKAIWFRPDPDVPGDATAYANVRAGIDAFGAANGDVTVVNTDAHTLTADAVHYSASAYGLHAASVISA